MPSPSRETVMPVQRRAKSRMPSGRRIRRPPTRPSELTRSPNAEKELLYLRRRCGPRVRLRAAAPGGGRRDLAELFLRHAQMPEQGEPREAGELLHAGNCVVATHGLAEPTDLGGSHLLVEAKRGRETNGIQRAVREPVLAAERLRHRMTEPETGAGERRARVHCSLEQLPAAGGEVAVGEDERERVGDQPGSDERVRVGLRVPSLHVQRLGAVSERVQGGAAGLLLREVEGELRLVDDADWVCAAASAFHSALLVTD